jgi:poly(3-hydroxybutyrate) depolymerase
MIAVAANYTACGGGASGVATLPTPSTTAPSSTATSKGCGATPQFSEGKYALDSDGTTREFWVHVPANYNPKTPHPLVVGLHWKGGQATDVYGTDNGAFYGLHQLYGDSAVFVAPNGLVDNNERGWANYNDRDIHFMQSMVDQLKQGLCIDTKHVYATGFSFGGMMSNAIGCQMGDTFRAVAPMSGALWSGCADSPNKVAAILIHSKDDPVVPYQKGEEARDKFLAKNGCSNATSRIGTNGCVEYQGCSANYPVVWCGPDTGGHWPPGFAAQEIKTFFDRF